MGSGNVIRLSGSYCIPPTLAARLVFPIATDTGSAVPKETRVTQGGFSWSGFGFKSHHHSCHSKSPDEQHRALQSRNSTMSTLAASLYLTYSHKCCFDDLSVLRDTKYMFR